MADRTIKFSTPAATTHWRSRPSSKSCASRVTNFDFPLVSLTRFARSAALPVAAPRQLSAGARRFKKFKQSRKRSYAVPRLPSSADPRHSLPPPERVPGGIEASPGRARPISGVPRGGASRRRPRTPASPIPADRRATPDYLSQSCAGKLPVLDGRHVLPGNRGASSPHFLRRGRVGELWTRDGTSSSEV